MIHDITVSRFRCFFLISYLYCHHKSPNLSFNSLAYSIGASWKHVLWPCLCEGVHVFCELQVGVVIRQNAITVTERMRCDGS